MKKLLFLFLGLSIITFSCKQNLIDAIQPKAAKNLKQVKARIIDDEAKWTIDEAYQDEKLIYKRNSVNTGDIELEYVRFRKNGVFEVKASPSEPVDEDFRWKLDEAKNLLIIYEIDEPDFVENWTIETGSVYEDSFLMNLKDEEKQLNGTVETNYLKLKMIKL